MEAKVDSQNNIIHKETPSLWCQIKEDFSTPRAKDPAFRSAFELLFNYPGLIAIVHYRVANRLYNKGFRRLGRLIMGLTQLITSIDIHPGAYLGRRVFIDHGLGVVIGESAQVGNDVTIYQGVSLGGVSLEKTKRHPTILHNTVIGAGAKILGDIVIGENVRIGSNSVVIKGVPDNCTAVGIPARVINRPEREEAAAKKTTLKLPDLDRQLFSYLICRMKLLEEIIDQSKGVEHSSIEKLREEKEKLRVQEEALKRRYGDFMDALGDKKS